MADFNITAIIGAEVKSFQDGMRDAKKSLANFTAESGKSMSNFLKESSDVMSKVGDNFIGAGKMMSAAITAPAIAGVTAAVKSYADLEQILGGVEKLFGDSADAVIRNSESAYRRAGVSGVDYMEQVTSFSATLLAGLDGDTVKAAEYADKAIVAMADNANTFGTNIGDIQNAYQGFAKDNYSMLDNLKLGFGGTAGEMARLVNESGVMGDAFEATAENVKDIPFDQLIEAIHVTQTEMGITGTTAKEAAETVSGSYDTMIAAGKDFIAGLGNVNTDTLENFHVLSESIETFAGNVKRVLETIWDNLPLEDWQKQLGLAVVAAGPFIAVVGVIAKVVGVVLGVFSTISGAFAAFSAAIATGATGFAALKAGLMALMGPVGWVTLAIVALIAAGIWLWKNWDEVKAKALELKDKLIEAWGKIKEKLSDGWDAVVQKTKDVWQGLKDFFKETVDNVVTTFQEMPEKIGKFFSDLDKKVATSFSDMGRSISNSMSESDSVVLQKAGAIVGHITDNFDHAYSETGNIFSAIWLTIKMTFEDIVQGVIDWGNQIKDNITTKLSEVGTSVSEFFGPFVAIFSQAWENIKTNAILVWESIKAFFAALLLTIVGLFTGDMELVKEAIGNAWQIIKDNTLQIWENIKGGLLLIWEAIKLKVSETWEDIKQKTIETWENVKVSVSEKVESLKQSAIDKFNALKEGIKTAVANLRDNVLAWFERVKTEVPQKIETMKSNAIDKFNEMKDQAIAKAIQLKDDVIAKVTEMINSVGTWISELPGKVKQGFDDAIAEAKSFGDKAVQAGRDLITGFVDGVKEKAQGLIDAVGGAISGAIDWAKGLLGIHSPSRVFRQFGIFTDEGFAEGIKKGAAGVKQSMGYMVGGAINEAESMTGQLNNALAASVSGGYAMTANGQLTINQQPAFINLDLGGRSYRAFVEDISNAQSQNVKFEESYSL